MFFSMHFFNSRSFFNFHLLALPQFPFHFNFSQLILYLSISFVFLSPISSSFDVFIWFLFDVFTLIFFSDISILFYLYSYFICNNSILLYFDYCDYYCVFVYFFKTTFNNIFKHLIILICIVINFTFQNNILMFNSTN